MRKLAEMGWIATGALLVLFMLAVVGMSFGVGATCAAVTIIPGGYYCDLHIEPPK